MWFTILPTNGAKMLAKLILLTIGLSGTPFLCILGSLYKHEVASPGYRRLDKACLTASSFFELFQATYHLFLVTAFWVSP